MKKILIIGISPGTFVKEIVDELVLRGNSVDILSLKPNKISKQFSSVSHNKLSAFESTKVGKIIRIVKTVLICGIPLIKDLKNSKIDSISDFVQFIINYDLIKKIGSYDVINIQGLSLQPFWGSFIKDDASVVASFLGSDILLNEVDTKIFQRKKFWIDKAKRITISSVKMRHIFQMKYGVRNLPKLTNVLYLQRDELYNQIDNLTGASSDKIRIAIGYNGYQAQNHLEILTELGLLDVEMKNEISLFFYFQYGGSTSYKQEVIAKAEQLSIPFVVQNNVMSIVELAQTKKNIDIQIITPDSDAFCGAVSESLFTGSILLTGSWLPYERYNDNGVYYETIDSFQEISAKLESIIQNFESLSIQASTNRNKVLATLDTKLNLGIWSDLLSDKFK